MIEDKIKEIFTKEPIKKIRITREAFEKINKYARYTSEIVGKDIECAGVLLNYHEKHDDIARDAYLSKEQAVSRADGEFNESIFTAIKEEGKKINGIWHSHGAIGTCHSIWDDGHLRSLFITNRQNKIEVGRKECKLETTHENGEVNIRAGDRIIKIKTRHKLGEITSEQIIEAKFANSIVINKQSYAGGTQELGKGCYGECIIGMDLALSKRMKNLEIELVEEKNGIEKDDSTLIRQIGDRVMHEGRYLREYPNFNAVLEKYGKEKQTTLEEKTIKISKEKNTTYREKLREFYQNHERKDKSDEMLANIAKILAGDYTKEGRRIWKWEDRIEEVAAEYEKAGKTAKAGKGLQEVYKNLERNSYVRKKHPEIMRKLKSATCGKIIPELEIAGCYACIGVLGLSALALRGIESASIKYLKKTDPEYARMLENLRAKRKYGTRAK